MGVLAVGENPFDGHVLGVAERTLLPLFQRVNRISVKFLCERVRRKLT